MNLIKSGQQLPARMEDLAQFVLIGTEQLTAVRAAIRALDKLNVASDVYHQKLQEAQDLGDMVIDAKTRIGELALAAQSMKGKHDNRANQYTAEESGRTDTEVRSSTSEKQEIAVAVGISSRKLRDWQQLAQHPELVEEAKQQARESGEIVGWTDALQLIKKQVKEQEREQSAVEGSKKTIDIDFRLGDFEDVLADIPDGSVDCIITDPPYPYEHIECWTKLSRFAKRVLKPHGFCVAYSGQMHLPEVMRRMNEHLTYYWTFAVYHEGQTQIVNGVNLICRWKPVLIFQNGKKKINNTFQDYFISEQREKSGHDWQQSKSGVAYLIEMFTKPNDLIVEPFAGSGTTLIVAKEKGRMIIGAEIDEQTYNIAKSAL